MDEFSAMKVKELIEILKKVDKNKELIVWDAYYDDATNLVIVSELNDGKILIANWGLGKEIK